MAKAKRSWGDWVSNRKARRVRKRYAEAQKELADLTAWTLACVLVSSIVAVIVLGVR